MSSSPLPFAVSTGAVWLLGCHGQRCMYLDVFGFRLCFFLLTGASFSRSVVALFSVTGSKLWAIFWLKQLPVSPVVCRGLHVGWGRVCTYQAHVVGSLLRSFNTAVSPVLLFLWFLGCFGFFIFYFTGCAVLDRTVLVLWLVPDRMVVVLWLVLDRTVVVLWLLHLFSFLHFLGVVGFINIDLLVVIS